MEEKEVGCAHDCHSCAGCGHDHDHMEEEMETGILTFVDDEGNDVRFEILDVVTLDEISKDLEVPVSKLEKFLLDRKLVQIMDKLEITCKNCGKVFRIETLGTLYCPNCRPLMENKLGRTF